MGALITMSGRGLKLSQKSNDYKKAVAKANYHAMKRAATTVKKEAAQLIRDRYRILARDVKNDIRDKVRQSEGVATLSVRFVDLRFPLKRFVASTRSAAPKPRKGKRRVVVTKPKPKPVMIRVTKSGGKKALKKGFVIPAFGNHVFVRGGYRGYGGKGRKLARMYSVSAATAMHHETNFRKMVATARRRFREEFPRQLREFLRRIGR